MSEEPNDDGYVIISLSVDSALLPEWFDEIQTVAATVCRRMAVIEKPEAWLVRIELLKERVPELHAGLERQWAVFVEGRRAEGRWED